MTRNKLELKHTGPTTSKTNTQQALPDGCVVISHLFKISAAQHPGFCVFFSFSQFSFHLLFKRGGFYFIVVSMYLQI